MTDYQTAPEAMLRQKVFAQTLEEQAKARWDALPEEEKARRTAEYEAKQAATRARLTEAWELIKPILDERDLRLATVNYGATVVLAHDEYDGYLNTGDGSIT